MRSHGILRSGLLMIAVVLAPVAPVGAQSGWVETGTAVHLRQSTDRVGIGTSTPAAKLHVIGGTRVEGTFVGTGNARIEGRLRALQEIDAGTEVITPVLRGRIGEPLTIGVTDGILRLEPTATSPNLVAGHPTNVISPGLVGVTLAGGGSLMFDTPSDQRCRQPYGGTCENQILGHFSTISGGEANIAGAPASLAGSLSMHSTVGGGLYNRATGFAATIPGGHWNVASGAGSFAAGIRAAAGANSFVWSDGTFVCNTCDSAPYSSRGARSFNVLATGGTEFVSAVDPESEVYTGVVLLPGAAAWSVLSDRAVKANVRAVDGRDILHRLSTIPITQWNLKAQDPAVRHIGPMAQDFYAAFGLGENERYINSSDADGIALISIQALHEVVTALERRAADLERKATQVERLAHAVQELQARLVRFERAAEVRP